MSRKSRKKRRRKNRSSNAKSSDHGYGEAHNELSLRERVKAMSGILIAATLIGILAGIIASHGHRSVSIWTFFICCLLYGFAGFKTWDDSGKRKHAESRPKHDDAVIIQAEPEPNVITPGTEATPEVGWPSPIPKDKFLLLLGDFVAWKTELPMVVLMQDGEPLITLNKEPKGVSLSAKFFTRDGKIIAEIERNEIHTNPVNFWRAKKTDHRLTILDDEAKIVVDVQYLNARTVKILGRFFARKGFPVVLSDDGITLGTTQLTKSGAGEIGKAAIAIP